MQDVDMIVINQRNQVDKPVPIRRYVTALTKKKCRKYRGKERSRIRFMYFDSLFNNLFPYPIAARTKP